MNQLNPQNFFDQTGGGSGAPSAKLSDLEDFVFGEIVDQFMAPATDFSTKEQKVDKKTGQPIEQLVVILQTDLRNWEGVSKVPLVVKDDPSKGFKPGSEDDGKRAVYVEPWTNIHGAVGAAIVEATGVKGPILDGGQLGVQVIEFRDTGKGKPLKVHRVKYVPPAPKAASTAFFDNGGQAAAPQQAAPAQAAPQQVAPAVQEQAAPVAPAQQDPWTAQQQGAPASQPKKAPF